MTRKRLKAPAHLRVETADWWLLVHDQYELEAHHSKLLTAAAEAWDRYQAAREMLDRDGLVVATASGGLKQHPAAQIEVNSRTSFARLL